MQQDYPLSVDELWADLQWQSIQWITPSLENLLHENNVAQIESVNSKGETPIMYLLDNGVLSAIELLKPFNVNASKVDLAKLIKRFGRMLTERNLRDLIELGSKAEGINTQLNSPLSYANEIERYDLASILHSELLKEAPAESLTKQPGA